MSNIKQIIAAGSLALIGAAASADECLPAADMVFTNDEGVKTSVFATIDIPDSSRNTAINLTTAVALNEQLKTTFGRNVSVSAAAIHEAPNTLCLSSGDIQAITANMTPVTDTGIKYNGDPSQVHIWASDHTLGG